MTPPQAARQPSRRVVTAVATAAVLVAGALLVWTAGGPAEAGGPVQRGTLQATNLSVPAGGRVALFGKIGKRADRVVKVQELRGDSWVVVARSDTRANGRFAVDVATPREPGTVSYRVLVPKYALIRSRTGATGRRYAPTVTAAVSITLTATGPSSTPATTPAGTPAASPSPSTTALPGIPGLPGLPGLPSLPGLPLGTTPR